MTRHKISAIMKYWPLITAIVIFLIAVVFLIETLNSDKSRWLNYSYLVNSQSSVRFFNLCAASAISLITTIWIYRRPKEYSLHPIAEIVALCLLAIAIPLLCLQTLTLNSVDVETFNRSESVILGENSYYVSSIWRDGAFDDDVPEFYLALFECNTSETSCKIVFDKSLFPNIDQYGQMPTRLIPDSAANTIALEINGEIVYTHHPH